MFTVIELQTNDGTTSVLTTTFADESLAYQKYHQILSFAAASTVDIHTAVVINEYGNLLRNETFDHRTTEES